MGKFCTNASDSKFLTYIEYATDLSPRIAQNFLHHFRFLEWRIVLKNISDKKAKG